MFCWTRHGYSNFFRMSALSHITLLVALDLFVPVIIFFLLSMRKVRHIFLTFSAADTWVVLTTQMASYVTMYNCLAVTLINSLPPALCIQTTYACFVNVYWLKLVRKHLVTPMSSDSNHSRKWYMSLNGDSPPSAIAYAWMENIDLNISGQWPWYVVEIFIFHVLCREGNKKKITFLMLKEIMFCVKTSLVPLK